VFSLVLLLLLVLPSAGGEFGTVRVVSRSKILMPHV
jgi:hypothetical protein